MSGIRQVCFYLTRRCNVACQYCNVIKHPKPELSTSEVLRALDVIIRLDPELLVFFGGEPLIRKDLQQFIDYVQGKVKYTIISNSVLPYSLTGVESLTASVDGLYPAGESGDSVKSCAGLDRLLLAKVAGVQNVTGNIIAHRHNALGVPDTVAALSEKGIWSIVGVVHCGGFKSGEPWRFRSMGENINLTPTQAKLLAWQLVEMKDSGKYLIHNSREYLQGIGRYGSDLGWHCSSPKYLTIDCDGQLIACNDRWGEKVPRMSIFDFSEERFRQSWYADTAECPGCYYNHQFQVEQEDEVIRRW